MSMAVLVAATTGAAKMPKAPVTITRIVGLGRYVEGSLSYLRIQRASGVTV